MMRQKTDREKSSEREKLKEKRKWKNVKYKEEDQDILNNLNKKKEKRKKSGKKSKKKEKSGSSTESSGIQLLYIHHKDEISPKIQRSQMLDIARQESEKPRKPFRSNFASFRSISDESNNYSSPSPESTPSGHSGSRKNKRQQKYVLNGASSDSSLQSMDESLRKSKTKTKSSSSSSSYSFFSSTSGSKKKSRPCSTPSSVSDNTKVKHKEKKWSSHDHLIKSDNLYDVKRLNAENWDTGSRTKKHDRTYGKCPPRIIYKDEDKPPESKVNRSNNKKKIRNRDEKPVSNWNINNPENDLTRFVGTSGSTASSSISGSYAFESGSNTSSCSPCQSPGDPALSVLTIHNPLFQEEQNMKTGQIMKTTHFMVNGTKETHDKQVHETTAEIHRSDSELDQETLIALAQIENATKDHRGRGRNFIYNDNSFTILEEDQRDELHNPNDNQKNNVPTTEGPSPFLVPLGEPPPVPILAHLPPLTSFPQPPPPPPPPPSVPAPELPIDLSISSSKTSFYSRPSVQRQRSRDSSSDSDSQTSRLRSQERGNNTKVRRSLSSISEAHSEGSVSESRRSNSTMRSDTESPHSCQFEQKKMKLYMKGTGRVTGKNSQDAKEKNFEIVILNEQEKDESSVHNWILRQNSSDTLASSSTPCTEKKAKKEKVFGSGTLTRVRSSIENLLQNQNLKGKENGQDNISYSLKKQKSKNNTLKKEKKGKSSAEDSKRVYGLRGKDISRPVPLVKITPPEPLHEVRPIYDTMSDTSEITSHSWECHDGKREPLYAKLRHRNPKDGQRETRTNYERPESNQMSYASLSRDRDKNLTLSMQRNVFPRKESMFMIESHKESHYIIETPVQLPKVPIRRFGRKETISSLNSCLNDKADGVVFGERYEHEVIGKINETSNLSVKKQPKGILKKGNTENANAPPLPKKRSQGNVVTYRLPSSPPLGTSRSRKEEKKNIRDREEDLGYECDSEFSVGEMDPPKGSSQHPPPLPPRKPMKRTMVLRGWRQKYEFLLGLVKEPGRLRPESLEKELQMVEAKRHGYAIERALVQANIDTWENMGGNKPANKRIMKDSRPESIRSLYEQVANLDCMLTSLETQIDVLSSVHNNLPKEFHDTFHDSGTSGHEPDSLEAIQTVVNGGGGGGSGDGMVEGRPSPSSSPEGDADERGSGDGGVGKGGGRRGSTMTPDEALGLLHIERCNHFQTRRDLNELREKHEALQQQLSEKDIKLSQFNVKTVGSDLESFHIEHEATLTSLESLNSVASSDRLVDELKYREMTNCQLRTRLLRLQKDRLDKIPLDAAKEINRLNSSVIQLEKQRDDLTIQNYELKSRLSEVTSKISDPAATYQVNKEAPLSLKENGLSLIQNGKIENERIKNSDDPDVVKILRKATYKVTNDSEKLRQMCTEFDNKEEEYKKKINELETEVKNVQNENTKTHDRAIREMENRLEMTSQKLEAAERYMAGKEEECNMLKLDLDTLNEENRRLKGNLNDLILKQKELTEVCRLKSSFEEKYTKLLEEHRVLSEDFNRERVLRKKYYNQVEEMKGKIRVYCRVRPVSELEQRRGGDLVTSIEDEFTVNIASQRGQRSFIFDRVFQPHEDQEAVFQDTNALVQSALDGFNVTIMAYGQTGSGKTYTMLGTDSHPGIAPRAFQRLFQLLEDSKARHDVQVSTYMLELYNDKLIDLLKPLGGESDRLEIKRDKKGIVHVQGAATRSVSSAGELNQAFNEGLTNRHTASTKMNVESSRSHLLISVCLTVTSKQTGNVLRGKLTLVDLAGSERVSKSGASADQLKEANSINKSLSALGDVISALSSESSFIPYRNSKLTMLLQDSLGGNAKTLVFVNASPAVYNADETLVSLMYASRIKQITNNVSKNADNKEITRLKSIISKLKKEEDVDEDIT